ncbi:MAG: DNA adenine methylase, partial [Chloroflexaceae bacterium]|nr:DNA adenine methylase [Chloroflexaceae bacterium]
EAAAQLITAFARRVVSDRKLAESCSPTAFGRWNTLARQDAAFDLSQSNHLNVLRYALLDFIGDFANWDNSTVPAYLETARLLTHIAHLALTDPGFQLPSLDWSNPQSAIQSLQSQISHLPRPLVVDPFAGGGSIPLEALRIGADAFASDLNPVAVLLNKVVLEYIPKYGDAECRVRNENGEEVVLKGLAEAVRYWGNWIKERAEKELAEFYPKDPDGSTPIAYLWARTIRCEGPGCGAEVPLMRSLWLAKRDERSVALRLVPDKNRKRVDFEIIQKRNGRWYPQSEIGNPKSEIKNPPFDGTVKRGSATCPVCGYTTPVARVREQLRARRGGA